MTQQLGKSYALFSDDAEFRNDFRNRCVGSYLTFVNTLKNSGCGHSFGYGKHAENVIHAHGFTGIAIRKTDCFPQGHFPMPSENYHGTIVLILLYIFLDFLFQFYQRILVQAL